MTGASLTRCRRDADCEAENEHCGLTSSVRVQASSKDCVRRIKGKAPLERSAIPVWIAPLAPVCPAQQMRPNPDTAWAHVEAMLIAVKLDSHVNDRWLTCHPAQRVRSVFPMKIAYRARSMAAKRARVTVPVQPWITPVVQRQPV